MIIDSHTHIWELDSKNFSEENLLASMEEAGIDYSMLIAENVIANSPTEKIIEICQKNPKLKAVGNVKYSEINNSRVQSLCDYLKEGKIQAVKFYPGYENFYPFDEKLFPLYEFCQSNKKAVIFHTGVLASGSKGLLKQSHPLNIDEVANIFPDLKIVMAHFGNPWIMDTAAVVEKNKNVYTDLSGYFYEMKPISQKEVEVFIKQLTEFKTYLGGLEKCLFGTDWPLYNQKEYLEAVKQLPMSEEEKELVFWKNANEIFNLDIN